MMEFLFNILSLELYNRNNEMLILFPSISISQLGDTAWEIMFQPMSFLIILLGLSSNFMGYTCYVI